MSDKRMEMLLQAANELTGEDLDALRGLAPAVATAGPAIAAVTTIDPDELAGDEANNGLSAVPEAAVAPSPRRVPRKAHGPVPVPVPISASTRGEYERQRTRDSKVATSCLGREREKHDWWPIGTELVGHMGSQLFTATVVENQQVKSGRSILITSGAANGRVCLTPTRAAIEATEDYRQASNLGRGGGVTNGWDFWQSRRS